MRIRKLLKYKKLTVCFSLIIIGLLAFRALNSGAGNEPTSKHKVFIAFGFHVNLYHSFRNDTNDESGFGKDIRIIRHIIKTLDRCNANGIPVKGVWDFDNLFSLQEILPQYAPDIIADIKRRVHENGDEVILMSYNNGLVSAMTARELNDAVRWSISNPWQSGVQDVFGTYTPIVRPQEMMTTPGNFSIYKKHGVKAVSLYYSATPFDTFRMFSRPLTRAEAHNPILYRHPKTKEEIVVIPTYHIGDLVEHVSLKHWVSELRELQRSGKLNHDALIFINYDADSELWGGIDLPWFFEWLPNTDGIGELVNDVKAMPNVAFTTLGDYLATHGPVGTFSFSQDTADGSYNGYNSWAEKSNATRYWTTIERSRRVRVAANRAKEVLKAFMNVEQLESVITFADMKRLRALSTTHFGMATPFLARQREKAMNDLMDDLDGYSDIIEQFIAEGFHAYVRQYPSMMDTRDGMLRLDTLFILKTSKDDQWDTNRFVNIPVPKGYRKNMQILFERSGGKIFPAIHVGMQKDDASVSKLVLFIPEEGIADGIYNVCTPMAGGDSSDALGVRMKSNSEEISNGKLSVRFGHNRIKGVYLDDVRHADAGSFIPYLKWGQNTLSAKGVILPEDLTTTDRSVSFRMAGPLPGPKKQTRSNGWMDYRFTLIDDLPYLMVQGRIRYPSTTTCDIIKEAAPGLIRRADLNWKEVAPVEIRFAPCATKDKPVRILKRNYLGISTEYTLDYFRYSNRNLNLDNINNHITESYVGCIAGDYGMAIAMDTSVQSNFAFAPMKMAYDTQGDTFTFCVNPFGTYRGKQYVPSTWGNRNGFDLTLLAGEQFAGAGPTYNGIEQRFHLILAFFNTRQIPEQVRRDMMDYAHPPMVISSTKRSFNLPSRTRISTPEGFVAAYNNKEDRVQFSWDNAFYPESHFHIFCGTQSGKYEAVYPATGNSLCVAQYTDKQPFIKGRRYYATIAEVSANGKVSQRAPEIQFVIGTVKARRPDVPFTLELKVLWANLHAMLGS